MDIAVIFNEWIGYIITFAVAIGISYVIFRETGLEKKAKDIKKEHMEQAKTGWGKAELERLSKMELLKLFKFARKENRFLYIGTNKIGKISKSLNFGNKLGVNIKQEVSYKLYLIKSGFLGMTKEIYFIADSEVPYQNNKNIFVSGSEISNVFGIFCTIENSGAKFDSLDSLIKKMDYEDLRGRLSNIASQMIYLDMEHAKNSDILSRKIEAMQMAEVKGGKSVEDFI